MTNPKLQINLKSQISNLKKADCGPRPVVNFGCDFTPMNGRGCQNSTAGYAAMFSFLVMTLVLGSLISVFGVLVWKSVFLVRTSVIEFKNIYAAEGFAEDTLKRARDNNLPDTLSAETLTLSDSTVAATLTSENSLKSYSFSAEIGQKYFASEVLVIDGTGPSAKIKKWQDTQ